MEKGKADAVDIFILDNWKFIASAIFMFMCFMVWFSVRITSKECSHEKQKAIERERIICIEKLTKQKNELKYEYMEY